MNFVNLISSLITELARVIVAQVLNRFTHDICSIDSHVGKVFADGFQVTFSLLETPLNEIFDFS